MNTAIKLICLVGVSLATTLSATSVMADDYAATGNPADLNVTEAIKMKLEGDTTLSRDARSVQVITTDTSVFAARHGGLAGGSGSRDALRLGLRGATISCATS